MSVLLRPDVPASRRSWLPLLTGVALAEAVRDVAGVRTALKWPNDLLAADGGTSLLLAGASHPDREALLVGYLRALGARYRRWSETLGDPVGSGLARDYVTWSATIGTHVAVTLPDGSVVEGLAEAVDWDGRLVVATDAGRVELASGDVRHVRRV